VPERITINDKISYIKASEEPLSSDVVLIAGEKYTYLFDVGNNGEVAAYLKELPGPKKIVLSHFHEDHMGNIGKVPFEVVYAGAATERHFQNYIGGYAKERLQDLAVVLEQQLEGVKGGEPKYQTPFAPLTIQDGVELEIYPMPNSHAKGSLALMVDKAYLFLGDSLYSKVQGEDYVYNAQLLKEEIELLKRLPAEIVFSSHEERPLKRKDGVVRFLEQIYTKREKNDAYIRIRRDDAKN